MVVRKLIRLRSEIEAQEATINGRRRVIARRYDGLRAHYRGRFLSPTALASSFATGIIVGTLAQRPRRAKEPGDTSRRKRFGPWLSIARTFAGPALLHILRTQAAGLIGTPRP